MASENTGWGAPRIHGELLKLGITISERTVSRYLRQQPCRSGSWKTFLRNHREAIAAFDLFEVPTLTFRVLYVLVVIAHERRAVLDVGVTSHPTAGWISQLLRRALADTPTIKYLIFDRDSRFNGLVVKTLAALGKVTKRTSYRSPWQNGVCERWILSCRRELLRSVIPLNEGHLLRLLLEYVAYYNQDRTHLALKKDSPTFRPVALRGQRARLVAHPKVGGLHHVYGWKEAA